MVVRHELAQSGRVMPGFLRCMRLPRVYRGGIIAPNKEGKMTQLIGIERREKYRIVRFYQDGRNPRTIKRGLYEWEAQKHCNDPKTHGPGWFDGYRREK